MADEREMMLGSHVPTTDTPSARKLAAIALILLLILIWAGFVATVAPWVGRLPVLVQAAFYLVMGIAWIIPLRPLIRWSQTGSFRDKGHAPSCQGQDEHGSHGHR